MDAPVVYTTILALFYKFFFLQCCCCKDQNLSVNSLNIIKGGLSSGTSHTHQRFQLSEPSGSPESMILFRLLDEDCHVCCVPFQWAIICVGLTASCRTAYSWVPPRETSGSGTWSCRPGWCSGESPSLWTVPPSVTVSWHLQQAHQQTDL